MMQKLFIIFSLIELVILPAFMLGIYDMLQSH